MNENIHKQNHQIILTNKELHAKIHDCSMTTGNHTRFQRTYGFSE